MSPILNQGPLNSCTENALATTIDILLDEAGLTPYHISRLQSYYDTRAAMGTIPFDSGSITTMTLDAASTIGLAQEGHWQYQTQYYDLKPVQQVYDEAIFHKINGYDTITLDLATNVRASLEAGNPLMLSFNVRSGFLAEKGPLETLDDQGVDESEVVGGHCTVIVGIDDTGYIVQNSWGMGWGDEGFGKITFAQFDAHPTDFKAAYILGGFAGNDFSSIPERNAIKLEYTDLLHREVDSSGLEFWDSLNVSHSVLATNLINSPEGVALYGQLDSLSFVSSLYDSILHREGDAGGLTFWVEALSNGLGRGDIAAALFDSAEAHQLPISLVGLPQHSE